jgi:hypothetical protein
MPDPDKPVMVRKKRRPDAVAFLEIMVALAVLAVLAVVIAGFIPLSLPPLARNLEKAILNSDVDSCTIQSVKVAFWRGVSFHRVRVVERIDSQTTLIVRAPECGFQGNLAKVAIGFLRRGTWPLLDSIGRQAVHGTPLAQLKTAVAVAARLDLFGTLSVSRATVEVNRKKGAPLVAKGISAECSLTRDMEGLLQGSLAAGSLSVAGALAARQMSASFSCDTNILTLSDCRGSALDGKVRCAGIIDLERECLAAGSLSVKNGDLEELRRWYDTTNGYIVGRADLNVTLDSSDLLVDSLRGRGDLTITQCTLRRFAFQKTLLTMFAFPHFARPQFDKVEAEFTLQPGGRILAKARGRGDTLIVTTDGWIRMNNTLDQSITCEFSKAGVKSMTEFLRKTLEETKRGGRTFTCRVYGKIDDPKFEIQSQKVLQRAVQNLFDDVRFNLQQWFR